MTQLLGDVELVTKQEVEAMLSASIVSESTIDDKVKAEADAREASENALTAVVEQYKSTAMADKAELDDKISDEAEIRDRRDKGIEADLATEVGNRETADAELLKEIASCREYSTDSYASSFVEKLKGLPIAMITVTNTDKSLHVGDTITTIDEEYFPKRSVDFTMFSEQRTSTGAMATKLLVLRLDNNGNVNVVNMVDITTATAVTDIASVMYFTER